MAKSDRVIKRGVRVDGKMYKAGQEDELGEVLPQDESDRLVEKGYLEGNWKGTGKGAAKVEKGEGLKSTK